MIFCGFDLKNLKEEVKVEEVVEVKVVEKTPEREPVREPEPEPEPEPESKPESEQEPDVDTPARSKFYCSILCFGRVSSDPRFRIMFGFNCLMMLFLKYVCMFWLI